MHFLFYYYANLLPAQDFLSFGKPSLCPVQSQQPLRESQEALLKKVEELTKQLKQERERALALEGQLTTATLSLQTQDKVSISALIVQFRPCSFNHPIFYFYVLLQLHERIADLEEERDLIKDNYDTLLEK